MTCLGCRKIFTSVQFIYSEVRRNGQGYKSVARRLETGEIRVFLDAGQELGELEELDQGTIDA